MHLRKKSKEHAHSILATRPELDGTGLDRLSYTTLHFNSRRTEQSVFMMAVEGCKEKQHCI